LGKVSGSAKRSRKIGSKKLTCYIIFNMPRGYIKIGKPTQCIKCGAKKMYRSEGILKFGRNLGRFSFFAFPFAITTYGIAYFLDAHEIALPYISAIIGIPYLTSILLIGLGEIIPQQECRTCSACGATSVTPASRTWSPATIIMGVLAIGFILLLTIGTFLIWLKSR
jgi:hypothetical protein